MTTLEGGCHCGNVRYSLTTDSTDGYYCHCRMCQLSFGNIFATFINSKKSNLKWLKNKPTYFASTKFANRGFCNQCGTPLTFEFHESENMDISVGSLDQPNLTKPAHHFATESIVQNWFKPDGLPQKRSDEYDKLQDFWKKHYGNEKPSVETARKNYT
jgi:hypothetical protein